MTVGKSLEQSLLAPHRRHYRYCSSVSKPWITCRFLARQCTHPGVAFTAATICPAFFSASCPTTTAMHHTLKTKEMIHHFLDISHNSPAQLNMVFPAFPAPTTHFYQTGIHLSRSFSNAAHSLSLNFQIVIECVKFNIPSVFHNFSYEKKFQTLNNLSRPLLHILRLSVSFLKK